MHEHVLRQQLHNEIHARPYERLLTPLQISHMAFLADAQVQAQAHVHLCRLLENHHLPLPTEGSSFDVADIGQVRLLWERHGEFTSYTFIRPGLATDEQSWFEHCACADISAAWREAIPGALICANHIALLPDHPGDDWPLHDLSAVLDADALVASEVADGQARVYTDLRIHADGFARFVIVSRAISPRRRGRLAQRLLEIETYRMLSLLALPAAREITPLLGQYEQELAQIMDAIRSSQPERDRQTLERLSQLASTVESLYAQHHARFTASNVYYDLVNRRIADLREQQFMGLQTLGQFMDRRLAPAMQTCSHAIRRLQGLSERISRCSNLLRTRVEVQMQQQNRELLASMNRRQYLQLRLQQTVEGLSVAAITYYASSLVGHLFEAMHRWLHVDAAVAQGWSIPIIALAVWLGLRRAHLRLAKMDR
ncbi:MAG: DUF3422 family protein [Thiomonas sp.]|uniref:DUF3422 domain-containing protein n=1 Tax=mine drainage metagenome TaxID=410659 RepID=E6PS47_9ZZZZ